MNNLLPYCGLVDARISASEKDLPVQDLYIVSKRFKRCAYLPGKGSPNYKFGHVVLILKADKWDCLSNVLVDFAVFG